MYFILDSLKRGYTGDYIGFRVGGLGLIGSKLLKGGYIGHYIGFRVWD